MPGRTVLCLLVLLVSFLAVQAAEFWDKLPYTKWDEKQCQKILTDSPWVLKYSDSDFGVNVDRFGTDGGVGTGTMDTIEGRDTGILRGGEREIVNVIQFRFVTAAPIRMAIGRMRMLQNPDNAQVRSQVEQYVQAPQPDQIVVEVSVYGRPAGHPSLREIENFFQQAELPSLRLETYLAASGRARVSPLVAYEKPSASSPSPILVFDRYDEKGEPYFTGDEKSIMLHTQIDLRPVGGKRNFRIQFELKPKKLRFNGALAL